jgi:hypothetical protein
VTTAGASGLSQVTLPRTLAPDLYTVRVVARRGEAAATSRLRLIVGPGLPLRVAEKAVTDIYWAPFAKAADEYPYPVVRRCHRFTSTRVDCIVGEEGSYEGNPYCEYIGAAFRAPSGVVFRRPYRCPGRRGQTPFKRAPHWTGKLREADPL